MIFKGRGGFQNVKKFVVQIVALLIVIIGGLYFSFRDNSLGTNIRPAVNNEQKSLLIKDKVLKVEVADTAEKRSRGLSGRERLDPNSGMLFVFNKPDKYKFWMKEMKIPLDLIFIRDGRVVDFIRNALPPAPNTPDQDLKIYNSLEDFNMFLEVNAGFIDQNKIDIGNTVSQVAN